MKSLPVPRILLVPILLRLAALVPVLLTLALAGALLTAPAAAAAELRGEDNVLVARDEVVDDDLYATGGSVVIDGTVRGDLLVAGGTVTINGTVEGDLMAAARTVVIEGTVGDDARVAAQVLSLGEQARVADDLITAGYGLQTRPGAEIGGDVLLGAHQALLAGTVGGDVTAGAAAIALAGGVGGDVQADVGPADGTGAAWAPTAEVSVPRVDPGLTLTDAARLDGDLSYRAGTEAAIAPGAEIAGEVSYEQVAVDEARPTGPSGPLALLLDGLRSFVTLFVVGLLMLWLAPRTTAGAAGVLRARPWLALGCGALAIAGTAVAVLAVLVGSIPVAVVLGGLTLGGLAAAVVAAGVVLDIVLVLGLVLVVALLAPVVVGCTAGGLLLRDPAPPRFGRRVLALALGLLVYVLLRAVPFLGPVVALLVALCGVGALVLRLRDAVRGARARGRAGRGGHPGPEPGGPQHTGSWPAGPGRTPPGAPRTGPLPGRPGPGQPLRGHAPQGPPRQARPPWAGDGSGRQPPPEPPR